MFANFTIKLPPFTSNKSHYRYSKNLTSEARTYRESFWKLLNTGRNKHELERILGKFDANNMQISVRYAFHLPREKFFTKNGRISARSPDLDNCIKLIQDFLFNSRYSDKHLAKLGYSNIGIDDRFITYIEMKKAPIDGEPFMEIAIEYKPL
jgi:Holliday junction resolvase RusA-like endonuclease